LESGESVSSVPTNIEAGHVFAKTAYTLEQDIGVFLEDLKFPNLIQFDPPNNNTSQQLR
jgi:hypothetical protein